MLLAGNKQPATSLLLLAGCSMELEISQGSWEKGKSRGWGSELLVAKISLWLGSSAELRQEIFLFSFEDDSYAPKYLPKLYLDTLSKSDFF